VHPVSVLKYGSQFISLKAEERQKAAKKNVPSGNLKVRFKIILRKEKIKLIHFIILGNGQHLNVCL
jgi:hypothetical protein